jgi:exodeoxyribonuclease V alpha subunit
MTGIAQRLFSGEAAKPSGSALAALLLSGSSDPAAYRFVSALLAVAKNGHLCLTIGKQIVPDPETLFAPGEEVDPELIRIGAARCPSELIADVSREPPTKPICRDGDRYYLQKLWKCETMFKQHYRRLCGQSPEPWIDLCGIDQRMEGLSLTEEQAAAVKASLESSLSIISGGPGTGKTYTAGVLLQVFWGCLPDDQRDKTRIVLAAPTGKAAQNLQKSFKRVEDSLPGVPPLKANTLHSVLGVGPNKLLDNPAYLSADVILVDECSMIDVQMMANLMASVRPGARLIMLGDSHQLPPVESGSLFSDMMRSREGSVELTKCLRTESQGIIELSRAIHLGSESLPLGNVNLLEFGTGSEWKVQKQIVDWACKHYPEFPAEKITPETLAKSLQAYSLLSPFRKGPLGIDELNEQIAMKLSHRRAMPIIATKSHAGFGLSNGDAGLLIDGEKAVFLNEEGGLRTISKLLIPAYEYAFCLSVHKSQGSEFDRVTLLMPKGAEVFGREVFYTGVTRARKKLDIWGLDETLKTAVRKKNVRNSGF